ncbi:MAG TPA: type III-A CRISPR-associated RAMP protein Csm3 [Kouleothrix sp.]|uniref:type III-A CRISPR-associated RAMP protein Csm3 n=1 Tax=Kouleothrix sp. TaxID=2779161 RepID=UPI002B8CFCED|nr:type III-A CRISPR-associated RAMP protein Csm3 [Kouleothrix sp.]HRC75079.1 type III-A CRISPR-associated RAMP protein Csm3 [Kouleothrix sp.]
MASTLARYRTISGTIYCETGLRIGGSNEHIEIGGLENTIIRHPISDEPYIPGSSLKGKLRSLLEYRHDRRDSRNQPKGQTARDDGEPCQCGRCMICRVFGPHKNPRHEQGPTRALFRDAQLTSQARQQLQDARASKGLFFTEVKTENMITRTTGVASSPRVQERVPAGTTFLFTIAVRIFHDDDETAIIGLLEEGLKLLEQDYLGASGSRGYGQVRLDYTVT